MDAAEAERAPHHDQGCLADLAGKAPCSCTRGRWLDVEVPRWQARAELLGELERWAREQRIFTDSDLDTLRVADERVAGHGHPYEMAKLGIRAAQSIGRGVWERIAVTALRQREDMECRRPPAPPTLAAPGGELDGTVTVYATGGRL